MPAPLARRPHRGVLLELLQREPVLRAEVPELRLKYLLVLRVHHLVPGAHNPEPSEVAEIQIIRGNHPT